MAGYTEVIEETAPASAGYNWVKPSDLINWKQDFCVVAIEDGSFDQYGKPQWTVTIIYVRQGQAQEKSFNLRCNELRDKRIRTMLQRGLPFHHMCLIEKKSKTLNPETNASFTYHDFADSVDNKGVPLPVDNKCACHNYGVIDPERPETWTYHYKMTRRINAHLDSLGMPEGMDTTAMSEAQLELQLKLMNITL